MNNWEIALEAREKGIVAIPCRPGSKIPAIRWKEWQASMPPLEMQRKWFANDCNIAIVTTGMVVFDCDDPAQAELVIEKCGETPHKLKSPRGIHLGYRRRHGLMLANQVKIRGRDIDIRTNGGLELIPDSETDKGRYHWLGAALHQVSDLPIAKVSWTRERTKRVTPTIHPSTDSDTMIRRAKAYVMTIWSISGSGGHNACYRAFCKCRVFGLTKEEALLLMGGEWNEFRAIPSWSKAELLHKANSVYKAPHVR